MTAKQIITTLLLATATINAAADNHTHTTTADSIKTAYTDSIFHTRLQAQQLTDSTTTDRLYHHLYQGMQYIYTDHIHQALNTFITILNSDPDINHPDIYAAAAYQIHKIYRSVKNYDHAYQYLQLAHQVNPNNTTYLEELAWFQYSIQHYDQSTKAFQKLNRISPATPRYIHGLAKSYTQQGKYPQALKQLDKYQHLEGPSIPILSERAEIWYMARKPQKAIAEITDYATQNPAQHLEAYYLLAQFYAINDQPQQSLNTLLNLNHRYPDNGTILLALAEHYHKTDNDTLHTHYTLKAIDTRNLQPHTIPTLLRPIIAAAIQARDTATITTAIHKINHIYPDDPQILSLTADTYEALTDTAAWLQTLYRLKPITHDDKIELKIIEIEQQHHNYPQIRQLTAQGYRKYKTDNWAYFHIISFGQEQENLLDSMLLTAHTLLPHITTPHIKSIIYQIIGDVHYSRQNDSIAIQMYDSCLHYNPKNSGALNNLAYNITKQSAPDLAKAEKYATKALEIDPESTTILDTYAWILYLRGDYTLAQIYFDKLVRIEQEQNTPTSPEILYHRGMLSIKQNNPHNTRQLFTQALLLHKQQYTDKNKTISEPEIITHMTQWLDQNNTL